MNIELTGRQTSVTQKLRQQAEAGLVQIAKIVGKTGNCHVILTEDGYRKIAEVTVNGKEREFVAVAEGTEMTAALHDALAKLEQQSVRYNQKLQTVRRHPKPDVSPLTPLTGELEAGE